MVIDDFIDNAHISYVCMNVLSMHNYTFFFALNLYEHQLCVRCQSLSNPGGSQNVKLHFQMAAFISLDIILQPLAGPAET